MPTLRRVPDWVVPSLRAVADAESYMLWLYSQTKAPQALGSRASLQWLGAPDGDQSRSPFGKGFPAEQAVWAAMLVADAIAEAEPYPTSAWWATRGIAREARMDWAEWTVRIGSGYERHYAHGVRAALGWVTGQEPDPRLMAPLLDGNADPVPTRERERYRAQLWQLAQPDEPIAAS